MKVKNTNEVLGAISEHLKGLETIKDFWDPHMVRHFPEVYGSALQAAGDVPIEATATAEVLQHHLTEVAAAVDTALHYLKEVGAEIVEARGRAARGSGTSNFDI